MRFENPLERSVFQKSLNMTSASEVEHWLLFWLL